MKHIVAPTLLALLASSTASAQVLITEVQPNPAGGADTGEYIEIHNTSTVAVSIDGWTLNDYTASAPDGESTTKWTFPALAALSPGQVIVIARQGAAFMTNTGMRASYELADGMDDPMVPNLTGVVAMGMPSVMQLVNGASGDAVALRDAMGTLVDGCEYGSVDRTIPGIPQTQVPAESQSLVRVANTRSSNVDFRVGAASPGVGYVAMSGPVIAEVTATPAHFRYVNDANIDFRTVVTDMSGVADVEIYLATATSSTGDSTMDYVALGMTSTTANAYTYRAPINNLAPGVAPANPADFHSLYVRWWVEAENTNGQASTEPANAIETSDNTEFGQRNVMPTEPSTIQSARQQDMNEAIVWTGHSVTVRGTLLAKQGILSSTNLDLAIEDASNYGIRVFGSEPMLAANLDSGDVIEVTGELTQFRGVAELAGELIISDTGMTSTVTPTTVTVADLLANAERYESRLVHIVDLEFSEPNVTSWPGMGNGGNVTVKDTTGEITVRITSGNELFNQPAPQFGFDMTGIVGQFAADAMATTGGYQVFPRSAADISAHPAPPPPDAGTPDAMGGGNDAGGGRDAGTSNDTGGGGGEPAEDGGCGCSSAQGAEGSLALFLLALAAVFALRRRS